MSAALVAGALVAAAAVAVRALVAAAPAARTRRRAVVLPPAAATARAACGKRAPAPPRWVQARGEAMGFERAVVGGAWLAWLAAAGGAPALALAVGSPGLAVVVAASILAGPGALWIAWRHRGDELVAAELPGALESVARSLRSGASLAQAVGEAVSATTGVLARDLASVTTAVARGAPLVDALEQWADDRPLPGVRLSVAALCLGAETGGAQARAVDGVAATLRQRLAVAAEARALATQARASAAVIAVAPLGFCALASATDPRIGAFLFRSGPGLLVVAIGLTLDVLGALWMARITRVAG